MKFSDIVILLMLGAAFFGFNSAYPAWQKERKPEQAHLCLLDVNIDCAQYGTASDSQSQWKTARLFATWSGPEKTLEARVDRYFTIWSAPDQNYGFGMELLRFRALYEAVDQLSYMGQEDRANRIKSDISTRHLDTVTQSLRKWPVKYLREYKLYDQSASGVACSTESERQALFSDPTVVNYKIVEHGPNVCLLHYFETQEPAIVKEFVRRNAEDIELARLAAGDPADFGSWRKEFLMLLFLHSQDEKFRIF